MTQTQRMTNAFFQNYGTDFFSSAEIQSLKDSVGPGGAPKDGGKELREKVRAEIERRTREQGVDPSLVEPQIDSLTEKISSMLLEGKSPEEIQRALSASAPR